MFLRFRVIWGKKWTDYVDDLSVAVALIEWECVVANFHKSKINEAINYCKLSMSWPPSVCEFIEICENLSGMPSLEEIMQAGIRRDFSHPIVGRVFEEIGSWSFSNDKERDLKGKIKKSISKIKNDSRLKLLE